MRMCLYVFLIQRKNQFAKLCVEITCSCFVHCDATCVVYFSYSHMSPCGCTVTLSIKALIKYFKLWSDSNSVTASAKCLFLLGWQTCKTSSPPSSHPLFLLCPPHQSSLIVFCLSVSYRVVPQQEKGAWGRPWVTMTSRLTSILWPWVSTPCPKQQSWQGRGWGQGGSSRQGRECHL